MLAPTQGDIKVFDEETVKRDVPPPPKFAKARRKIRPVEVLHELNAKKPANAKGDVAIAREVAIDLKAEGEGR